MKHNLANTLIAITLCILSAMSSAQVISGSAWFGILQPPGIGDPHSPSVDVQSANSPPARVPSGEEDFAALEGEQLFQYVDEIVGFSRQSRAEGNRVWGRVTGFPSAERTIRWAADQSV